MMKFTYSCLMLLGIVVFFFFWMAPIVNDYPLDWFHIAISVGGVLFGLGIMGAGFLGLLSKILPIP